MESALIHELRKRTGVDEDTAHMLLQTVNWDVTKALKSWYQNEDLANVDRADVKRLARGISRASGNENLVSQARADIARDFENNCLCKANNYFLDIPNTCFMLPCINRYFTEFREFLEQDLISKSVLVSLENGNRLNWWCNELGDANKLWPLATSGDGNCLLHAASLSIYGFHDRLLTLRRALYHFILNSPGAAAIKRRWRWQQTKCNIQSNVCYSEDEWEREWSDLVTIASPIKRKSRQQNTYESLEELHILALANVLQRVIVVIAETILKGSSNEPLSPIHFGGIYLPFECDERKCSKTPLFFTYDMAHFSSLVFMDKSYGGTLSTYYVPLVDSDGALLPIQFSVDPGPNFDWDNYSNSDLHLRGDNEKDQLNLLKTYLNVMEDVSSITGNTDDDWEAVIDKHYSELTELNENDYNALFNKKNKATKQLEVFSKQFGSIGKSMGKRLKKNFGSLTKLTTSKPKKNEAPRAKMICIEVCIKRHPYQEELIKNYLSFAEKKFFKTIPNVTDATDEKVALKNQALMEGPMRCINNDCSGVATCITSYMCISCYKIQRKREISKMNSDYGVGKSKFYREPELKDYDAVKEIPKSTIKSDPTIYLSNSTFFNDTSDNMDTMNKKNKPVDRSNVDGEIEICSKDNELIKYISNIDFGNIVIPNANKDLNENIGLDYIIKNYPPPDVNSNVDNYEAPLIEEAEALPLIATPPTEENSNLDQQMPKNHESDI